MPVNNMLRPVFSFAMAAGLSLISNSAIAFEYKQVTEDGLVAEFYYDENAGNQRPVIIFGGSGGGYFLAEDERSEFAKTLVDQGYAVLLLVYFDYKSRGKLPKSLTRIPLEYFATAMSWLGRQPGVRSDSFAVYGSSRGGELALLLATHYPQISVVIAGVPSAYVWPTSSGHTLGSYLHPCAPAWTFQGRDIPGICTWKMLFSGNKVILNKKFPVKYKKFIITVENMAADVLLLSGKQDKIWPSTEMCNRIVQRLEQYNYSHDYKHIVYDAGHFLFKQSWEDVLEFLETHYPVSANR